ncbi:MAG: protein-disulfide reductase DsbD [Methylococcaceae bacterium]
MTISFFPRIHIFLMIWLIPFFCGSVHAASSTDLLPAAQAFPLSVSRTGDTVQFQWHIAPGYYLYREKFKITAVSSGVSLVDFNYPKGFIKHDEFFGDMEIFRDTLSITARLLGESSLPDPVDFKVTVQGCADAGVCYPPYTQTIALHAFRPNPSPSPVKNFNSLFKALGHHGNAELLSADEAFSFSVTPIDAHSLTVSWRIAEGYFLYRDKIGISLSVTHAPVDSVTFMVPHGDVHDDAEYGAVEILRGDLTFPVSFVLPTSPSAGKSILQMEVSFQGCADRGVCYPPQKKLIDVDLPVSSSLPSPRPVKISEQDQIAMALGQDSLLATALSFLGFGFLLSFTPCVFPMIPILSGIIVGHGHQITAFRGLLLSLAYVLASALTYTFFGILAGLFGQNLQAVFQDPLIILAFSSVFILLSLSMFDLYTLQMPGFIQNRLVGWSQKQGSGTLVGAFVMGSLSALIVGPCVAAPLAGALIYIGQTGDVLLGGMALFFMGLGMGIPLLVVGASAGKLLPKAGVWMNAVKSCFGVGLLATAAWLLSRIIPAPISLFLWAALLIIPSVYLGALDPLPQHCPGWRKLLKGTGVLMFVYGVFLLIGAASNQNDPLTPLSNFSTPTRGSFENGSTWNQKESTPSLPFRTVTTVNEVLKAVELASQNGQWAMLDFYADWCVSCKELERYTFNSPSVQQALSKAVLLRADLTKNTEDDQMLLRRYGLIGPPAILFFGPDKEERKEFRVVGYMDAEEFLGHIELVIQSCVQTC